jgi:lysozyme family protein
MQNNPDPAPNWSPRFDTAVSKLLGIEGGYVNHRFDKGGATKFGISLRFLKSEGLIDLNRDGFADFDLDFDGDIDGADVRALSVADAKILYHQCFWQRDGIENLPKPLGEAVFDQAVNGGSHAAKKMLQQAINLCLAKSQSAPAQITVDGQIGTRTLQAMNWVLAWGNLRMLALIDAYRLVVANRYRAIVKNDSSQAVFLKGWLRRANKLGCE